MASPDHGNSAVPSGVVGLIGKAIGGAGWLVRRPFIAPQWAWVLLTLIFIVAAVCGLAIGVPIPAVGALVALAAVGAAVWVQWWLLGRGDEPVVVLSPYTSTTPAAHHAAATQLQSLRRYLTTDENILDAGGVVVRQVSVPIRPADAKRLLRLRAVVLVVRGQAEAGGDSAYFLGDAHYREDGPTVTLNQQALSIYVDAPRRSRLRTFFGGDTIANARHEEGGVELRRFVASSVRVDHFKSVAKVLLVLLAEIALKRPVRLRQEGTLVLPEPNDPTLGDKLQARSFQLEAELRRSEDPRRLVEQLEQQASDESIGGAETATWLIAQWFSGEPEGWTTAADTLAAARRWSTQFPASVELQTNLAATLIRVGELDEAADVLKRARNLGLPDHAYERYLGNLAWARQDAAGALKHYRRAARRSNGLGWQIADCYLVLGQPRRALHAARRTLRDDPFRTNAAEIARRVRGWPRLMPAFAFGWRGRLFRALHIAPRAMVPVLDLWRWLRPEDPYVAVWIARAALLRGDMHRANEWLTYASRFAHTSRVIAAIDTIVVMALVDHQSIKEAADWTAEHIAWLEERGVPAGQEAAMAVAQLFEKLDYLDQQPPNVQKRVVTFVSLAAGLPLEALD